MRRLEERVKTRAAWQSKGIPVRLLYVVQRWIQAALRRPGLLAICLAVLAYSSGVDAAAVPH